WPKRATTCALVTVSAAAVAICGAWPSAGVPAAVGGAPETVRPPPVAVPWRAQPASALAAKVASTERRLACIRSPLLNGSPGVSADRLLQGTDPGVARFTFAI